MSGVFFEQWPAHAVALTVSLFMLAGVRARAQESAERPDSADAAADTIEEIIVTAQKREQALQDVPIAISAISTEQIERRGIDNLLDLKAFAPNLMVSKYPNSNDVSQVAIRGGGTVSGATFTYRW